MRASFYVYMQYTVKTQNLELTASQTALAKKLGIEVPVSNAIYEAVYTDITPKELLAKLMNRKLKEEERYV